ncbi:hypothetical protein HYV70_03880 [Candidatus Uhrbacteria bacterium]|nr:hypothetical protein [Candidatus Uhrbacteria bacterium]
MRNISLPFFRSIGMMIGAMIGVGVFGLPYAFTQSGFTVGLLQLLVLGVLLTILQLMFAEVVVQTPGAHRLVSYVGLYLGPVCKWVTLVAFALGIWGAMLAYMVVGGGFLHSLFFPLLGGVPSTYSYVVAIFSSLFIFGGLKYASKIEVMVIVILLFLFLFIILASLPHIQFRHYVPVTVSHFFVPYGVILFAFAGLGIVPEIKEVLGNAHSKLMSPVILFGMSTILFLYAFFSFAIVGVSGPATSVTAFEGLVPYLGETFRVVTALLGSITIFSIYLVLGIELLNTFKFDFHRSHRVSWFFVCIVPVLLFYFGFREFIDIISFVGGVFGGILGILVAVMYWVMRRSGDCKTHHCINFPAPLTWILIAVFSLGIIIEFLMRFNLL